MIKLVREWVLWTNLSLVHECPTWQISRLVHEGECKQILTWFTKASNCKRIGLGLSFMNKSWLGLWTPQIINKLVQGWVLQINSTLVHESPKLQIKWFMNAFLPTNFSLVHEQYFGVWLHISQQSNEPHGWLCVSAFDGNIVRKSVTSKNISIFFFLFIMPPKQEKIPCSKASWIVSIVV